MRKTDWAAMTAVSNVPLFCFLLIQTIFFWNSLGELKPYLVITTVLSALTFSASMLFMQQAGKVVQEKQKKEHKEWKAKKEQEDRELQLGYNILNRTQMLVEVRWPGHEPTRVVADCPLTRNISKMEPENDIVN